MSTPDPPAVARSTYEVAIPGYDPVRIRVNGDGYTALIDLRGELVKQSGAPAPTVVYVPDAPTQ